MNNTPYDHWDWQRLIHSDKSAKGRITTISLLKRWGIKLIKTNITVFITSNSLVEVKKWTFNSRERELENGSVITTTTAENTAY